MKFINFIILLTFLAVSVAKEKEDEEERESIIEAGRLAKSAETVKEDYRKINHPKHNSKENFNHAISNAEGESYNKDSDDYLPTLIPVTDKDEWTAVASSQWNGCRNCDPDTAIDGLISTEYDYGYYHADNTNQYDWLQVDFGQEMEVGMVVVTDRIYDGIPGRYQNIEIRIGNEDVSDSPADEPLTQNEPCNGPQTSNDKYFSSVHAYICDGSIKGRYLTVQRLGDHPDYYHVNEIDVYIADPDICVPPSINSSDPTFFPDTGLASGALTDECETDDTDWSQIWLGPNLTDNVGFVVDIGCARTLRTILLRNSHNFEYNNRGTNGFRVDVSADLMEWTTVVSGNLTKVNNLNCDPNDPSDNPIPLEEFPATSKVAGVRFLRFNATSYHGYGAALQFISWTAY